MIFLKCQKVIFIIVTVQMMICLCVYLKSKKLRVSSTGSHSYGSYCESFLKIIIMVSRIDHCLPLILLSNHTFGVILCAMADESQQEK